MRKDWYRNNAVRFFGGLILSAIAGSFAFYGFSERHSSNEINYKISANPETVSQTVKPDFGELPLGFEANAGQTDGQVKFISRGHGYALFLTGAEAVLSLRKNDRQTPPAVLRMRLDGANQTPEVAGENEVAGKSNYFVGDNPSDWKTDIPNYSRVRYEEVYPGIDQVFYGNGRELEYDFVVAPDSDASQIALEFEGADDFKIAESGDLILSVGGGQILQKKPFVYQDIDGERREIAANYKFRTPLSALRTPQVGFVVGEYDRSQPLVIDPVLVYSTYLGGTGFDQGYGIAVDSSGNTYLTGQTGTPDFPTTPGAFDTTYGGGTHAFVTKINAAGNALVYSTFIAGAVGNDIAVDSSGNAYVTGETGSPSFPTTPGAFETPPGGFDTFILKLNPSGSALVYSSSFGGSFDDFGRDIALDAAGNAYITGWTKCLDFQLCNYPRVNAFQQNYGGGNNDAFVTKLNASGTALIFSTYLGGGSVLNSTDDWGDGIAVDGAGNVYVTGFTFSLDFPVTAGAFDTQTCGLDAFITKFAPNGSTLVYSTLLGGCRREQGMGIAVDAAGNAFVAGITESDDFPATLGAFQTTGSFDAFATKLNPTGTALVYSTYLGGTEDVDRGWDLAVDNAGNAYVAGDTKSDNFPVTNAVQTNYGGGARDAFASKLNPAGTALIYSTYLGGSLTDQGRGIAVDGSGSAYITGDTSANNFPVTAGAFQTQNGGGVNNDDDAFVAKIQGQPMLTQRAQFDFDGDGKADVSVFRPSNGTWYLNNSQNGFAAAQFGLGSDKLAPADYDGDGKTDIAVFRNGIWYLSRSQAGFTGIAFGNTNDVPVPADFNGDGKSELAVFRPSNGTWYFYNLVSNQTSAAAFGQMGDKPVAADYDGDGKADVAVFRNGTWYLQRSTAGFTGIGFGTASDIPVPSVQVP